uniref:uncharacterized protein LOC117602706 isoform X1 n=1 Tax=Osmia lignaria TaxID=473952 RepID=UPI0014796C06|nr:uncharacterized protein LOC117602706 isoform X1 [Osmia lignaria]XP_034176922.1 uncharacterized protein LOC117602706 isoform X1 [Osmia lignaria]XP_034176923.1 uncharacterized protein LOC117602706 isoform X1 [Osmia lignaria]XP_034176924.1 uncharacterized protein LOC117602706 isoform X1 [Osmia lignaria]XP_034176925.1 uncharacterized protein LOC117602706 isoform X1 [Osmia lignaria]
MNDEIILRTLTSAGNIPFVDEDGVSGVDHRRARSNLTRREATRETSTGLKQSPRNSQQSFASFRSMVQSKIVQEESVSALQKGAMHGRKESPQYRRMKQSPSSRRDKNDSVETGLDDPTTLQRYENAVLRYQKPKTRAKRQASRDRQQQQQQQQQQQPSHGCSSSDESVARNKSKSISSIDTQSVNNILDEYEDLDYRRSSDLSDSGSVNVSNFEAVMMDQQKKQQQEKTRLSATRMQPKRSPVRERSQPVLKVNQQTQVRQRSRERQKEAAKHVPLSQTEDNPSSRVSQLTQSTDAGRVRVPEVLLRKGEVQKRVDEWLSQTQSQSYPVSREKALIRSNSSAEQKSQRRYRQDSRSRSIDEGRDKLNGTSSSYDDLSRADRKPDNRRAEKIAGNPGRGSYKEYLASKNRSKQQDYGFSASTSVIGRSRDASPSTGSRIPQRGPLSSSFRSRRLESGNDTGQADNSVVESAQHCQAEKNSRVRSVADSRSTNLAKTRNESLDHGRICGLTGAVATGVGSSSSSVIPCRRASFKRAQNHDQSSTRALVKEETGQRTRGGCGGTCPKGPCNLGDQGEPISPNKEGESRRSALTNDCQRDKATDAACKSTEASKSVDRATRDVTIESARHRQEKREPDRTDQARQESVYGVVGARVRTLQGQQECRVAKTRNPRGGAMLADARKPPVLPRKDQTVCSQESKDTTKNSPLVSVQSSFKPNSRVYATLQQLNEQNSVKSRSTVGRPLDKSPGRSQYSSPNHVEKIYERSLQPQVIHADDLESILRPSLQVSAYGEPARSDRHSPPGEAVTLLLQNDREEEGEEEEEVYERVGELRYEHLETIEEDDRKSEASVYPEIGLSQCLKIQQGLPNGRDRPSEPARTFVTFHSAGSPRANLQPRSASTGSYEMNEHEEKREVDVPIVILDDLEIPYDSGNQGDRGQACHTRENSDLSTATIPLDELESERQLAKFKVVEDECTRSKEMDNRTMEARLRHSVTEEKADRTVENERSNSREMDGGRVSVNEVLLKNLQFKQDLPKDSAERVTGDSYKIIEHVQRPIGFHNVLCDDYENARDARFKENKVYVTKEEMERQRLMDLLRKGDYESAKMELERSYTLSTPGGSSPVCCPPCSPPPAPAAYISSARASSRRLGAGSGIGGPPSPERDPLGRLLRFLKTFYRELGTRDPPHLPGWASPLPLGTLCPAHFQPHLQLLHKGEQEHRLENIKTDQIFAPVRLSDGTVSEAPRRVAIEGGPGSGRTTLCLRLLHQWAIQGDGPALAFIVPLRELRGSPVLNYLARELFPRTAAIGDAVTQVWRTLHLMEDRVLFILDGYDECVGGRASLGDAVDLLEGRLFPDARILVTCSPNNSGVLSPLVQRRIHLAGLEWSHVERLCVAYFIHNDIAEKACEFLEALNVQPQTVKQLGQHPLGWIMLCCLYQDSGSLPTETSALVQAAVKCIVRRSLDPPVPYSEEVPGHCRKRLEDFGKLSLAALREGRCCYTEAELRARGGGIEVSRLGFLTKGLTFGQRRKPELYTPIHTAVAEFLAAYYLTSVAQYANILRRELEGLPSGIISHLAGLLGPKTHLILNQLCPLEVPPRAMFSLLKAAGASDGNISAVCRLVGAGPGFGPAPNERPPAPLVHTSPLELEGWARILESTACTLEALEVVFQVERGSDPRYLDDFFEALAGNESVKLVRITSLLGQEFPADEAQKLAGHLKSVLGKKKLNDFELVITCLEEAAHDRLECVVNALCRGLSHASSSLARLVLDMNLSGEQVSRVCEALRSCVQVQALHLPHLGCGCEGLASVAELLKERPLLALNLAGSWGAKNEDPSSSGISMGSGSGSGSSGCASSTLGTLPLNRCYSSLPRGALAAYGSLTRPATLPRLPLGLGLGPAPGTGNGPLPQNDRDRDSNGSSKRNSDSVLCHRLPLLHPLPTCDLTSHQGTGFHEIFNAIREPNCKLRSLNVSKCLLGGLDAGCLGETIRRARNLDALRAAGASRPADVMPLVLALTEAPCLQLLDLASPRLALDDHPSRLLCHALARNTTLKLLSLEGWTFRIEESDSLAVFSELLRYTSVRELSLCNARLHLAVHEGPLARLGRRDDAGAELLRAAPPPACPAIVFLRLAGFQVTVNDRLALRGPLLLPFLAGFTALSELDLSLDKSTIGGNSGSLLFIDDKILQQFFSCLSSHFKNLQSLRINFWRVTLEDSDKTMRQIAKYLKLCNLSFLKANGLIVTDSAKKVQMEHVFVQTVLTHLQYLTWLCLDGVDLTESQASSIGKCVRDRYPGTSLDISAKDVHVKSVKALVAAVEEGGRAEVVYTGGSNCRLKITKLQKNGKGKKK